jgi:L-alanine-DL-glutamate epimerase-like enolase superfamily enzyme
MTGMELSASLETTPLREPFRIARGLKEEAVCLLVELTEGGAAGRGLSVAYPRFGETPEGALMGGQRLADDVKKYGLGHDAANLEPGALANAVDLAAWDLTAKATGTPVAARLDVAGAGPLGTARTVVLAAPDVMARQAEALNAPILKAKLNGDGDDGARLLAIRAAAPEATLWADANEGLSAQGLIDLIEPARTAGLAMLEQPCPPEERSALTLWVERGGCPLCADEAVLTPADLDALPEAYSLVNIKLDKCGGLTSALTLAERVRAKGLSIMVGCMVAPSLGIAPAVILAHAVKAEAVDLDGPFLVQEARAASLAVPPGHVMMPEPALWG